MKFLLIVILLILGVVVYVAFGPDKDADSATPQPTGEQIAAPQDPSQHPKSTSSLADDVNSVVNYGIGATQVKAKRHMTNKLDSINKTRNQDLDRKLTE